MASLSPGQHPGDQCPEPPKYRVVTAASSDFFHLPLSPFQITAELLGWLVVKDVGKSFDPHRAVLR